MTKDTKPFVTVIMPVRNEAQFISRSLTAVLNQDYPHESMEVIVADGMSGDGTREIVYEIASHTQVPVRIIDNLGLIVPTGFNTAMKFASGEIIVRVDGHCEIASDYLSRCVQKLLSTEAAGVGGPIETISLSKFGNTVALAMSSPFGVGGSSFRTVKNRQMYVDTIAFPAYKRSVMETVGPLDEELVRNQDDEYNYRLRSYGYKLLLVPEIRSRYYSRSSLKKLWLQYYQYGLYKVRVLQKHPLQMRPRQFVPLTLVTTVVGCGILAPFHRWLRRIWFVVLVVYGLADLAASIVTARRAGWLHLRFLPIVFAILHFSYGIGFLHGLIKFGNRWRQ